MHPNKDETKATAVARAVYLVAREDGTPESRRFLATVKFNLGPDPPTVAYRLQATASGHAELVWEPGPVPLTAEEILRRGTSDGDAGASDVDAFLRKLLQQGPQLVSDIFQSAERLGISRRQCYGAKQRLGAIAKPSGFGEAWAWSLPAHPENVGGRAVS
jgi:hypothetical protein